MARLLSLGSSQRLLSTLITAMFVFVFAAYVLYVLGVEGWPGSPSGSPVYSKPSYHDNAGVLRFVNPKIGTYGITPNGNGGMIPSVSPPFGMTRWTPQTREVCLHLFQTTSSDVCDYLLIVELHLAMPLQRNGLAHPRLPGHPPAGNLDGREWSGRSNAWRGSRTPFI